MGVVGFGAVCLMHLLLVPFPLELVGFQFVVHVCSVMGGSCHHFLLCPPTDLRCLLSFSTYSPDLLVGLHLFELEFHFPPM